MTEAPHVIAVVITIVGSLIMFGAAIIGICVITGGPVDGE